MTPVTGYSRPPVLLIRAIFRVRSADPFLTIFAIFSLKPPPNIHSGQGIHLMRVQPAFITCFFKLCASIGTTSSCAIDQVKQLAATCSAHNIWLHVDAAYAASAAICPEHKCLLDGIEVSFRNWMPYSLADILVFQLSKSETLTT